MSCGFSSPTASLSHPQTNNDSDVVTMAGGKLLVGYHCQALFQALDNSYHATVHILSFPPYREDR